MAKEISADLMIAGADQLYTPRLDPRPGDRSHHRSDTSVFHQLASVFTAIL